MMTELLRRRALRAACLAAGLLLPAACTMVGPDFEEPQVGWLDEWDQTLAGLAADGEDAALWNSAEWWRVFEDPLLESLIEEARRNSPEMRIAALRILESRALLGIAGSTLYPQVQEASGAVTRTQQKNHANTPGVLDGGLTSYDIGLSVGWEIDFWGRFRRGIESADAAFFASIENQRALQVLINAQVANLYFAYRVARTRVAIARQNVAGQKRSLEITQELFASGNTSELDVQQARAQYLGGLASIPPLEQAAAQIANALAVLIGRPPGTLRELETGDYHLPTPPTEIAAGIPARLLLRRPDVRAALWQAAAQSAQIGIAEADFYPAISLAGFLGWAGTSVATAGATTLSVGPAFRWNIFDYGRIRNNVRLQDARLQQLFEQYQNTVLNAAAEVDNAAIGLVKSVETLNIRRRSVASATRALEIATVRYREGYAGFQRVLDAQQTLFVQSDRLTIIHGEAISNLITLYKSLGGGWSGMQIDEMLPAETREKMKERVDWGDLLDEPLPEPPVPLEQSNASTGS